jgi:two-component system, chemotaxis family, sensor histidine kinase and response regulator PixL
MLSFDSDIQDQAYQFFIQESVEFLQILEAGLMDLTQDHDVPKIHELMRAAHSIKGGAASVGLNSIKQLSYQLEDCLRALYQDTVVIDTELEDLLLQAFDCLKEPLLQQIETGEHDEEAAIAQAEPIYELLVVRLGDALANVDAAMPTSAELGIDIVLSIFAGDVQNGIQRIEQVLSNPDQQELVGEIRAQVEVFVGVGELVNLPGWVAIAKAILAALQQSPDQARTLAEVAIANLKAAQQLVLDGDRTQGGEPSAALLAYGGGNRIGNTNEIGNAIENRFEPAIDPMPDIAVDALDADLAFGDLVFDDLPFDDLPFAAQPFAAEPFAAQVIEPIRSAREEQDNADRIAAAETVFDGLTMMGWLANSDTTAPDFDQIPTEQLDELFALAMSPEDVFGPDDKPLPQDIPPAASLPILQDMAEALMPEFSETVLPPTSPALEMTPEPFSPPSEVDLSGDDLANLDAFFDLALTEDAFDLATDMVPRSDAIVEADTPSLPIDEPATPSWDTVIHQLDDRAKAASPEPDMAADAEFQNRQALANQPTIPEQAVPQPLAANALIDAQIRNLLENADRGIDQIIEPLPPITRISPAIKRETATPKAATGNNVVRVDLARLEQINNRVGAMVTQENRTMLQNQQIQSTAQAMLQRFSQFETVARQIGAWSDRSQQVRAKLTQQAASRPTASRPTAGSSPNWQDDFDPLQMDTYGELYGFAQEMLELMAQMGEGMRDLSQLSQGATRSQHQQQQILKQLRDDLLWARMLPLDDLLQRFPRMMRDLASRYGKPVKLELSGTHTLVDKSVLQSLYDPLVHLLRNGFDHGIETPEERIAQGKPAQATIAIRAYHRGNQTHIDIIDDGRGIDPDRIRAKVVENQLLTAAAAAKLAPEQLYPYLFAAGFSTAGKVSELSGRGVGLDAVQSQLASLKGAVAVTSVLGQGSTFSLQLPLTLTVASLLIFTVQSYMMAAPIDALKAIVAVPKNQIKLQQGRKVYDWNGQPVPLCPRSQFLQSYPLPRQLPSEFKPMRLPDGEMLTLLLIETADRQVIALVADQVLQEQELAIKPFGTAIAAPHYFYGCTIMGNGLLVPVLDVQALVKPEAPLVALSNHATLSPEEIRDRSTMTGVAVDRTPVVLVVDDSLTTRQTLALTLQKAGYRVLQAKDGREGIEQVEREPDIKAVFCDVEMPRMNGFEFLSQSRLKYTKEQLPIIMLTSRGGEKHRQIARYMGANDYLTKPYLAVDIMRSLEAVLAPAV